MRCEDAKCYLCAYLDGELDPEKAGAVAEHLKSCQSCRNEFENLECVSRYVREHCGSVFAPDYLLGKVLRRLERADDYRESGVQVLDLISWGTHIAQLYNTRDELAEILVPYLGKGLEENELCVWITSEISQEEAMNLLSDEIPDIGRYIESGQLQLFSHKDWFLPDGCFDGECGLDNGIQKYEEAVSNGYSGLRITGNVFWMEKSDWHSFMNYEQHVNDMLPGHKMLIMCAYKESNCSQDNITDVIKTHRYVLSKTDDLWRLIGSSKA